MPLIDVHNHILSREYADLLARFGGHRYSLAQDAEGRTVGGPCGARPEWLCLHLGAHQGHHHPRWGEHPGGRDRKRALRPPDDRQRGDRRHAGPTPSGGSVRLRDPEARRDPHVVAYLETEEVAKQKFPERLEIVREFPITASGKIQKFRLRESPPSSACLPSASPGPFAPGNHRGGLQSPAAALGPGLPSPHRVRGDLAARAHRFPGVGHGDRGSMSLIARKPDAAEDAPWTGSAPGAGRRRRRPAGRRARISIRRKGGRRSEVRGIEGGGTRLSTQTVTHFRVSLQGFTPSPSPAPIR